MNLKGKESIILQIGDLKLSDTLDTFGEKKYVNGILYVPLINPHGSFFHPVGSHLALGDSREGVVISNDNTDEIFFTYGSNTDGSNAKTMAIGYHDKNGYFFIMENFSDIYGKTPTVSSREIVRCEAIFDLCSSTRKAVYICCNPDYKPKLTRDDNISFEKLMAKISTFKDAFCEENLDILRLKSN